MKLFKYIFVLTLFVSLAACATTAKFPVSTVVPAGTNYSIWVVTKGQGTKNVGQLLVSNGDKATFKTTTAFDFDEVFITVENQSDLTYPTGVEISRTKF